MELVECRWEGTQPPSKLRQWVKTRLPLFRKRLAELDLIASRAADGEMPLLVYLDGQTNEAGGVVTLGWKQILTARGSDANRAHVATKRSATSLTPAASSSGGTCAGPAPPPPCRCGSGAARRRARSSAPR